MKQQICILGSTGSIGTQALDVISQHPDLYEAYALTANHRWKELAEQARRFNPAAVVIADEAYYEPLQRWLAIRVLLQQSMLSKQRRRYVWQIRRHLS